MMKNLTTILALAFIVATCVSASAEDEDRGPLPVQPNIAKLYLEGHKFTLGEPCTMMTKNRPGVIKRDACKRWYCGRPGLRDIVESRPNLAAEMGCEWRLIGEHCLCQRSSGEIIQPQSRKQ